MLINGLTTPVSLRSSGFYTSHNWRIPSASQQHSSSFGYYETHDPRYGAIQYPSRASPSLPNDPYNSRRLPPMSMPRREEEWPTSSFAAHMPFSDEIRSPTASYPSQYASHHTSHHMPQQASYPYPTVPSVNRNIPFPAAPYDQQSQMYMGKHSLAERVVLDRKSVV